ncbi:MAG TPA: amidohydrolase family protein [Gemmatimonadales bacterium]|jgi:imidazolonepropionase-like amidohydrolase
MRSEPSPRRLDHSEKKRPGNRAFLFLGTALTLAGAACARAPEPEPVTVRAGLLLDGRGGLQRDALITVVGSRISAVAPYRSGPVTYDLSRYTVLPGLIDLHVHISGYINRLGKVSRVDDGETEAQRAAGKAGNALATLRAGFTTVVSLGSESDGELRDSIEAGRIPGPRILTSLAPFSDTGLTPKELRRLVRRRETEGADVIKIFGARSIETGGEPSFSPAQLAALCGEARRAGLRSIVHVQSDASIAAAAAAGCDQAEHGFFASAAGLEVLARSGVEFDPQCRLVFANYLNHRERLEGIRGFDSAGFAQMERMLPTFPPLIRSALATPGLSLLYGSDATAGAHGNNADDLVCRVREAGQSPMDALVTATSRNAAALGLGDVIGTIAPGFAADLIALEGDPLTEIEAVKRVVFVMRSGRTL